MAPDGKIVKEMKLIFLIKKFEKKVLRRNFEEIYGAFDLLLTAIFIQFSLYLWLNLSNLRDSGKWREGEKDEERD